MAGWGQHLDAAAKLPDEVADAGVGGLTGVFGEVVTARADVQSEGENYSRVSAFTFLMGLRREYFGSTSARESSRDS